MDVKKIWYSTVPGDAEGVEELSSELWARQAVDQEVDGGVQDSQVAGAHISTPLDVGGI